MKILIVYDSFFGNTQKISEIVFQCLDKKHDVKLIRVDDFKQDYLEDLNLLIVGSPTRAFSPSEKIKLFLNTLPHNLVKDVDFAVFDTRIDESKAPIFLKFLMKIFGYADKKIVKLLKQKCKTQLTSPKGFFVEDKEGPLKSNEMEKARKWAKALLEN